MYGMMYGTASLAATARAARAPGRVGVRYQRHGRAQAARLPKPDATNERN